VRVLTLLMFLLDGCAVMYVLVHFLVNLAMVFISLKHISRDLRNEHVRPAMTTVNDQFLPKITLLVPAYNEEVTIVDSLRSLMRLRYPSFEIIICNDGSKDRTVEVVRRAFHFVRTEVEERNFLKTSNVKGFYEARVGGGNFPPGLKRLVLIDKENGGKADALNAAINVAQGDYVTSMDADSLLIPEALLMAARLIVRNLQRVEGGRWARGGGPPAQELARALPDRGVHALVRAGARGVRRARLAAHPVGRFRAHAPRPRPGDWRVSHQGHAGQDRHRILRGGGPHRL